MTTTKELTKGPGRPSIYKPEFHLPLISRMVSSGSVKSLAHVAAAFGVTKQTLKHWAKEDPELNTELQIVNTANEAHLIDILYGLGTGEMKGSPTAIMMLASNLHGWKSSTGGGHTEININAENVTLSYSEINTELQKYLDKMGVKHLGELENAMESTGELENTIEGEILE